jgi:REP element-mobilizing transposase RayT
MTQRRLSEIELPVFITTNIVGGEEIFTNQSAAEDLRRCILIAAKLKNWEIVCFQIMPNHIHLIVNPKVFLQTSRTLEKPRSVGTFPSSQSALSRARKYFTVSAFVQSFKGTFSRQIHKGRLWQLRYYLKYIVNDKQLRSTIAYIIGNPEKDGLPEFYTKEPFAYIDRKIVDSIFG